MNNPLVTVRVLSYNAENTIIDTLESVKNQTYDNIELIVSDDCSKDNTVEKARAWIEQNKHSFKNVKLLTVPANTGICANLNRTTEASSGEWTKGIAADDKLLPNCIEDFISFVEENPEANWVSSYMRSYINTFEESNCISTNDIGSKLFFDLDATGQLKMLAYWNRLMAPSLFFKTEMIRKLGGYDPKYGFEDYPFSLKALEHGYKCYLLEKETVAYRVHESTFHSNERLFNYPFVVKSRMFDQEKCFQYLSPSQRRGRRLFWKFQDMIQSFHLNKNTRFMREFYRIGSSIIYKLFNR